MLPSKGGAKNLKVGGVNALEGVGGGVNTVKTVTFEKGGGYITPPARMVALSLLPRPGGLVVGSLQTSLKIVGLNPAKFSWLCL